MYPPDLIKIKMKMKMKMEEGCLVIGYCLLVIGRTA